MGESEVIAYGDLVDDGGLVLGTEARGEGVFCLGGGAVDAVDGCWDGGGDWGRWEGVGWGEGVGLHFWGG